MYLLDTNVVSEETRAAPDPRVAEWMRSVPLNRTFLSVLTLGELERGVAALERKAGGPTRRSRDLSNWLSLTLTPRFEGRILPVTAPLARHWGQMLDRAGGAGQSAPPIDALLAATALHHRLTLVTRNTADFDGLGVPLLNPWED